MAVLNIAKYSTSVAQCLSRQGQQQQLLSISSQSFRLPMMMMTIDDDADHEVFRSLPIYSSPGLVLHVPTFNH